MIGYGEQPYEFQPMENIRLQSLLTQIVLGLDCRTSEADTIQQNETLHDLNELPFTENNLYQTQLVS